MVKIVDISAARAYVCVLMCTHTNTLYVCNKNEHFYDPNRGQKVCVYVVVLPADFGVGCTKVRLSYEYNI